VSGISVEGVMIEVLNSAVDLSEQPTADAMPPSDNRLTNVRRVNIGTFNGYGTAGSHRGVTRSSRLFAHARTPPSKC